MSERFTISNNTSGICTSFIQSFFIETTRVSVEIVLHVEIYDLDEFGLTSREFSSYNNCHSLISSLLVEKRFFAPVPNSAFDSSIELVISYSKTSSAIFSDILHLIQILQLNSEYFWIKLSISINKILIFSNAWFCDSYFFSNACLKFIRSRIWGNRFNSKNLNSWIYKTQTS
jgi:hypothetical protein